MKSEVLKDNPIAPRVEAHPADTVERFPKIDYGEWQDTDLSGMGLLTAKDLKTISRTHWIQILEDYTAKSRSQLAVLLAHLNKR